MWISPGWFEVWTSEEKVSSDAGFLHLIDSFFSWTFTRILVHSHFVGVVKLEPSRGLLCERMWRMVLIKITSLRLLAWCNWVGPLTKIIFFLLHSVCATNLSKWVGLPCKLPCLFGILSLFPGEFGRMVITFLFRLEEGLNYWVWHFWCGPQWNN